MRCSDWYDGQDTRNKRINDEERMNEMVINEHDENGRRNIVTFRSTHDEQNNRDKDDNEMMMHDVDMRIERNDENEIRNDKNRLRGNALSYTNIHCNEGNITTHSFERGRHEVKSTPRMNENNEVRIDGTRPKSTIIRSHSEPRGNVRMLNTVSNDETHEQVRQPAKDAYIRITDIADTRPDKRSLSEYNTNTLPVTRGLVRDSNGMYAPERTITTALQENLSTRQPVAHQRTNNDEFNRWPTNERDMTDRDDNNRLPSEYRMHEVRSQKQLLDRSSINPPLSIMQTPTASTARTIRAELTDTFRYADTRLTNSVSPAYEQPASAVVTKASYIPLGKYSGKEPIDLFLHRLQICRRQNRWTNEDALNHLSCALEAGAAQILWENPLEEAKTVEELIQKLQSRYGCREEKFLYQVQLQTKKQAEQEDLGTLSNEIRRLTSLAFGGSSSIHSEMISIKSFLDAMSDRSVSSRVLEHDPVTLDQAYRLAVRLTAYKRAEQDSTRNSDRQRNRVYAVRGTETGFRYDNNNNRGRQMNSGGNTRRQWNQNGRRPVQQRYTNRDNYSNQPRRCWTCQSTCHLARDCQYGSNEAEPGEEEPYYNDTRRSTYLTDPTRQLGAAALAMHTTSTHTNPYVMVRIGKKHEPMLVDTGSTYNLASADLFREKDLRPTQQRVFAADGRELTVVGQIRARVRIGKLTQHIPFTVAIEVQGLIAGMRWLRSQSVNWNVKDDWCMIGGRQVPIHHLCSQNEGSSTHSAVGMYNRQPSCRNGTNVAEMHGSPEGKTTTSTKDETASFASSQQQVKTDTCFNEGGGYEMSMGTAHKSSIKTMSKTAATDSRACRPRLTETIGDAEPSKEEATPIQSQSNLQRVCRWVIRRRFARLLSTREMATWNNNSDAPEDGEPAQNCSLSHSVTEWLRQAAGESLERESTPRPTAANNEHREPVAQSSTGSVGPPIDLLRSNTWSPVSSVSDDVIMLPDQPTLPPPVVVLPPPVVVLPPLPCLSQPNWRIHTTGLLWRMFVHLRSQGHLAANQADVDLIRNLVPPLGLPVDLPPLLICMAQTMATQEGVETILQDWYRREGRLRTLHVLPGHNPAPRLNPWRNYQPWSFGTWSLCVLLQNRFLSLPPGSREDHFLGMLNDVYSSTGSEGWTIEPLTATMFFVKNNAWTWSVVFRQTE